MIAKDTIISHRPDILLIKGNHYLAFEGVHNTITVYDHFGSQITMLKEDADKLFKKRKKNWYNKLLEKTLWKI